MHVLALWKFVLKYPADDWIRRLFQTIVNTIIQGKCSKLKSMHSQIFKSPNVVVVVKHEPQRIVHFTILLLIICSHRYFVPVFLDFSGELVDECALSIRPNFTEEYFLLLVQFVTQDFTPASRITGHFLFTVW